MGEKNRATASTKMNEHSSRSHAILILRIEHSIKMMTKTKVKNVKQATDRIITCSDLYLVDLAGSERVKKTGATADRLKEAKLINQSLLALGNVISALSDPKSTHISYRDSKLTRLLQNSLGGNSKTALIVTVSPSTYNTDETISSLFFALRAMKVQNKPTVNKSVDYQALCQKLQEDLDKLNDDYAKLKIEYEKVVTELERIKKGEKYLEIKKSIDMNNIDGTGIDINNGIEKNIIGGKNSGDVQKIKNDYKKKIKKLEEFYENLMKNKTEEYENILKKVDGIVYEKEAQIDQLTSHISELNTTIKTQKTDIEDLTKERDELQKSVVDLSTQVQEHKELMSVSRTEKEYKALIEQLNDTISTLENKILNLEDDSSLNINSKDKISESLNTKIDDLQEEINKLTKKLNDCSVLRSQNEIKLKLSKAEALKSKSFKEKLKTDIIESQRENFKLIMEEESTNKRIDIIEKQITCAKNINDNLGNLLNEYKDLNKHQLMINLINKDIDTQIKDEIINGYENAFIKEEKQDFTNKFMLFKGEGDINTIINRVSFLNNNYQSNIFKLDNLNKDLNSALGEPNNSEKITQIRDNIQTLLEETQEINHLVKKEMHKDFSSFSLDDNIPFERCPKHLDKLFTNIIANFNTLVDAYNLMNSNVCLLLSILVLGSNGGKQIIENLSEFIQNNVGDIVTKKNLENQINILNECGINTNQFFNNLAQIIKDLFEIIPISNDGENRIKVDNSEELNELKKLVEAKDKEIGEFKNKIKDQSDKMIYSKDQLSALKKNVNQLNDFLKLNEKDGKLDVKKITKIFNGYNDKINDLIGTLSKIPKTEDKDLSTGKYFFGQFLTNVTSFTMSLYNYGFKDEK
jgi:chromosome segregation ATPase